MMKGMHLLFFAVTCVLLPPPLASFSTLTLSKQGFGQTSTRYYSELHALVADSETDDDARRQIFRQLPLLVSLLPITTPTTLTAANAAVMDPQLNSVFKEGKQLSMAEAEARLKEGRKSIQYLLDHYDEISQGGGDNVRRYLGTVGTTSGMFGIGKVMTVLSDKADDFVEYTELSNEVIKSINQADGSAYMAIFVTTSTSQTPPSKYFGDAKIEIKRCIKALDELAALIDVKL